MNEVALSKRTERRIFLLTLLFCIASLALCVFFHNRYRQTNQDLERSGREGAQHQARLIVEGLADRDRLVTPAIEEAVDSLAGDLGRGALREAQLLNRLQQIFEENRDSWGLLEIGIAWNPLQNQWRPGRKHAPHYGIKDEQPKFFQVEESYDYTVEPWYVGTRDSARWIEPYFGKATRQVTTGYAAPFYTSDQNGSFAGVVRINIDLEQVRQLVADISSAEDDSTMRAGYVVLLSGKKRIIAHPVADYAGKDIVSLVGEDGVLRALWHAQNTEDSGGEPILIDENTGETYWYFQETVESTGWTAVVLLDKEETLDSTRTDAVNFGLLTIAAILFICSSLVLVLRAYRGKSLWLLSSLVSIVFVLGIMVTWLISIRSGSRIDDGDVRLLDGAMANAIWRQHEGRFPSDSTSITIRTGVFVQSVRFTGANNVVLTGYVWQRYEPGVDSLPGVILPEAEEISIAPAYESGGVKGWYFETTLRQQFDYSRYPFDREDVWIRLWPGRFDQRFVLVPDFGSYKEIKPATKPGLERDFVLEGWTVEDSYFSYRTNRYNVNLGQTGFSSDHSLELYFNIGVSRKPVSPFVADIIPLIVVAFLVFAVLMISTRHEEKMGLLGFSTSAVLGYCAALFFVLIVSHVHLRETLAGQGIIYMEHFYFVMYFAILWVSVNSLLFSSSMKLPLIKYRDNLLAKQLYWPVLTALLFAITLRVFVFGPI